MSCFEHITWIITLHACIARSRGLLFFYPCVCVCVCLYTFYYLFRTFSSIITDLVRTSRPHWDQGPALMRLSVISEVLVKGRDKVLVRLSTMNGSKWKVLIRIAAQTSMCVCVYVCVCVCVCVYNITKTHMDGFFKTWWLCYMGGALQKLNFCRPSIKI